jgi:hypothetical protein
MGKKHKKKGSKSRNGKGKENRERGMKSVFKFSLEYFVMHPITIIPIFVCWAITSFLVIYLVYFFGWDVFDLDQQFLIIYIVTVIFAFVISIAGLILLEIMEQYEKHGKANILIALFDCFAKDVLRALPVILIWSVLWFALTVIDILISYLNAYLNSMKGKNESKKENVKFSFEDAAKTLAGIDFDENKNLSLTLLSLLIEQLKKGLRMTVFIILAAIAWEKGNPIKSTKRGLVALKWGHSEYLKSFGLSDLFQIALMLPILLAFLPLKFHITYPDYVWVIIIICTGLAQSLGMLVEQLSMAKLYLRFKTCDKENPVRESQRRRLGKNSRHSD